MTKTGQLDDTHKCLIFEADDCNDPGWGIVIDALRKHIPGFKVTYAAGDYMNFWIPNEKYDAMT